MKWQKSQDLFHLIALSKNKCLGDDNGIWNIAVWDLKLFGIWSTYHRFKHTVIWFSLALPHPVLVHNKLVLVTDLIYNTNMLGELLWRLTEIIIFFNLKCLWQILPCLPGCTEMLEHPFEEFCPPLYLQSFIIPSTSVSVENCSEWKGLGLQD